MNGFIEELYEFTNGKSEYKLYIQLTFWFNRTAGLALPILSLQYNDVKINLELNDLDKCYIKTPTNYITIDSDIVHFQQDEVIYQTVNDNTEYGRYIYYDEITKNLYYHKITDGGFVGISGVINSDNIIDNTTALTYKITGETSEYFAVPIIGSTERTYTNSDFRDKVSRLHVKDCFLLVEYIYIDGDERNLFAQEKHEYLIEQVQYNGNVPIDSPHRRVRVGFTQPSKYIIWLAQQDVFVDTRNNLIYNYTNDFRDNGDPLISESYVLFHGLRRCEINSSIYYKNVQGYQYFHNTYANGIYAYSFCLHPRQAQNTGSCNMSKIDDIDVELFMDDTVSFTNKAKCRSYNVVYNVLRVAHGLCGLVFTD